jgi:hypothetical protein
MTSHIPEQREQMVRYYGFYINFSRGLRERENEDVLIPCVKETEENAKPSRNWARLIQKIYQIDPLTCPHCQGLKRIINISICKIPTSKVSFSSEGPLPPLLSALFFP